MVLAEDRRGMADHLHDIEQASLSAAALPRQLLAEVRNGIGTYGLGNVAARLDGGGWRTPSPSAALLRRAR